jgi:hypothetical protein
MDAIITPLAITSVDYDALQKILTPNARLDQYHIEVKSLLGYLASLSPNGDPRRVIRDLSYILKHASATFLFQCDQKDIWPIMANGRLTITEIDEERYVATGNLEDWKLAALDICVDTTNKRTRYILNCCVLYIERAGLQDVFGNYRKVTQPDQTFVLHRKD